MLRIIAILLISTAIIACDIIDNTNSDDSDTQRSIESDGLVYRLNINQSSFAQTDTLEISFHTINLSFDERDFFFPNRQQLGVIIYNTSDEEVFTFPQIVQPATSSFTLKRGETNTQGFLVPVNEFNPEDTAIDEYRLEAFLLGDYPKVDINFTVNQKADY